MNIRNFLIVIISLILLVRCSTNKCKEGEYTKMKYVYNTDSEIKETEDRIFVERTVYSKSGNNSIILEVFWRAVNLNSEPTAYGWENKFLIQGKKQFRPTKGLSSDIIDINDTSRILTIEYNVSEDVLNKPLTWGLWLPNENKLAYQVELSPEEIQKAH